MAVRSTLRSATHNRDLPKDRFFNRELSRLDFDSRVLSMAEDGARPLEERLRFLAIVSDSLDDFFQVRVAGLHEQVMAPVSLTSPDGMTPEQQLDGIGERVRDLIERQSATFSTDIVPALADAGFKLVNAGDLTKADHDLLTEVFQERIFPVLTPLAVDPAHPSRTSRTSRSISLSWSAIPCATSLGLRGSRCLHSCRASSGCRTASDSYPWSR